ncbi:MAG: hypothetical protein IPL49_05425 [Saprospirales bacterium]|nr:hypothetical protein [Saprospirales bacterium]
MNRFAGILIFFLLAGAATQLSGQPSMAPGAGSASAKASFGGEELSFYVDEESETYFIDFEPIRANLNEIVLKNASGNILFQERVSDMPVDAIYELDMSRYSPGQYRIELHTFTGVLFKDIQVR